MARLPDKLLGGRVRTSTVLLSLLFAGVLLLYLSVRPQPTTEKMGEGVADPSGDARPHRSAQQDRASLPTAST